jgi:glycosyltransferase involved in cell wall biosynthesis
MFAKRPVEQWLMRHALRWHDGALTLSEISRQELRSYSQGEIIVVGLGLSHPEMLQPRSADLSRPSRRDRSILYLGDDRPRKGLADFMRAAELVYAELDAVRLVIVSKYKLDIQTSVPCEFVYSPAREELADYYASCDLFVSASWREGFGLPPLEAMACGAPVVLTDSGGVREYARPGENCLLVQPRDPSALAAAMLAVLNDRALADRFRRAGPATAAQFTWTRAADRFEQALESFL